MCQGISGNSLQHISLEPWSHRTRTTIGRNPSRRMIMHNAPRSMIITAAKRPLYKTLAHTTCLLRWSIKGGCVLHIHIFGYSRIKQANGASTHLVQYRYDLFEAKQALFTRSELVFNRGWTVLPPPELSCALARRLEGPLSVKPYYISADTVSGNTSIHSNTATGCGPRHSVSHLHRSVFDS